MKPVTIENVINYIFQDMTILAGELSRLETDLVAALGGDADQMSPEMRRVFSGYMLTITKYAEVMTKVSKMLETISRGPDPQGCATPHRLKQ